MPGERCLLLDCAGSQLLAILHAPARPSGRGVIIVVGGPQYRVGSHRQFVLLARHLASRGSAVLRFDYRGMGDADGPTVEFRSTTADIRTAIDALIEAVPEIREIVLWGLCDAAAAILIHARSDPRIRAIALANPWVRSETGNARAQLRHYYLGKLVSRDWWRKLVAGRVDVGSGLAELGGKAVLAAGLRSAPVSATGDGVRAEVPFQQEMLEGLEAFTGPVLLIVSGNDLTAAEFLDLARRSRRWRKALRRPSVRRVDLPDSDHTFSRAEWRDAVASATAEWLGTW